MSTAIGIRCTDGVVLAADTRLVRDDTVRSGDAERVFGFGVAGAAAVGEQGDVDEFGRQLEAEVREYRLDRDDEVTLEAFASVAADVAAAVGVQALVAAPDGDAVRLREVGADGSVLEDDVAAIGSGTQFALGQLETFDTDMTLDAAESRVREVLAAVTERDPETGEGVALWRSDEERDRTTA